MEPTFTTGGGGRRGPVRQRSAKVWIALPSNHNQIFMAAC